MLIVLLVDDDVEFIDVVCIIIEFFGYEVLIVFIFVEVCEWFFKELFDYILLDFMLFDGLGLYLMELLQFEWNICVILIIGYFLVKGIIKDMCGLNIDYLVKFI